MRHYTEADVKRGAKALFDAWSEPGEGWDYSDASDGVKAVLEAVAPTIAARALREAADIISRTSTSVRYEPGWLVAAEGLRARADEIEGVSS